MRIDESKSREWSQDLLDRAVEFHGHGGPFMIVGLKLGLTALKLLKAKGWFGLKCRLYLPLKTPYSCIIDGIQVATGCTMGKRNIEAIDKEGIAADFTMENKRIRLRLRQKFLDSILENIERSDDGATRDLIDEIIEAEDIILFEMF